MTEEIQYIGEHLWPGRIGHAGILLAFVAGLLATVSYFMVTRRRENPTEAAQWLKMGRTAFVVHGVSILTVITTIFFMMVNKYYEYQYVQAHVNDDLLFKYVFSAFWEGQEGSFLLWMFWHVIIGGLLLLSAKEWEPYVLSVLASIQVVLVSMILGVYVGLGDDPVRIGSNPTLLLRDVMDAPIFAQANYVSLLEGTGLNPLLQNWWMTVHPPTLFFGFASTSVPFAFAVAGLWSGKHREWLKPALPWALMSGGILGAGILMGGAWAYEALSFGGYWAWDPVENMSLVPWLILVAGIHTNLVARNTSHGIRATYVYYMLTFVLIVYSTFLTRSGVLGETSVHAFTEMGLENQLILFILLYTLLAIGLLVYRHRQIPQPEKEEAISSREFWMFIGSLVFLFSSVLITAATSLPVYNKIRAFFDPAFVGQVITDPVPYYNKQQLWVGVLIGLLSGIGQYLRYREINFEGRQRAFLIRTAAAVTLSAALTFLTLTWINAVAWQYKLLLFTGWFAIITNADYLLTFLRGNVKASGSVLAHLGFGVMVIGVLASGLNKEIISQNPFLMEGLTSDEESKRNTVLLIKDSPMALGPYEVTFAQDTIDGLTRTFTVDYKLRDEKGNTKESFSLTPNVLYEKDFTKIAASNPSTKHYWDRDVFTHVAALPEEEIDVRIKQSKEDSLNYRTIELAAGEAFSFVDTVRLRSADSFLLRTYKVEALGVNRAPEHPEYSPEEGDLALGFRFRIHSSDDPEALEAEPLLVLRDDLLFSFPVQLNEYNMRVKLDQAILDEYLVAEDKLDYQRVELKAGEQTTVGGLQIRFSGYDKEPDHPYYRREEKDIAVAAMLEVKAAGTDSSWLAQPVFFIRDSKPMNIKDEVQALGLHIRFASLDPATGKASFFIARYQADRQPKAIFALATDAYRSDWIALQAISFPGINLFWLGSSLMMIGLTLSMFYRIRLQRS